MFAKNRVFFLIKTRGPKGHNFRESFAFQIVEETKAYVWHELKQIVKLIAVFYKKLKLVIGKISNWFLAPIYVDPKYMLGVKLVNIYRLSGLYARADMYYSHIIKKF